MTTPPLFWIPGAVPSSKNSRLMTKAGFFIGSKATQKYRKRSAPYWKKYKEDFKAIVNNLPKPIILGMHFIRGSRHKWDFLNPAQTIQDEMCKAGWIEDDNIFEVLPVPLEIDGKYWAYDKSNPGVYIAVLSSFCEGYINIKLDDNKPA